MRQVVEQTCEVICEDNGRKMVADILYFKENQNITVSIDKKIKLDMRWNRRVYEGNMGGLTFVTDGPNIINVKQGR